MYRAVFFSIFVLQVLAQRGGSRWRPRPIGGFKPGKPTPPDFESVTRPTRIPWPTRPPTGEIEPAPTDGIKERKCPNQLTFNSFKNYIFYGTLIGSYAIESELDCVKKCFSHPYCESANFYPGPSICELNSNSKSSDIPSYKYRLNCNFIENIKCPADTSSGVCGRTNVSPRLSTSSLEMAHETGVLNRQLTEARPHSQPWTVSVQRDKVHVCTGVLVAQFYVMTSASCFAQSTNPTRYQVILGSHSTASIDAGQQTVSVEQLVLQPGYEPQVSRANDLALLKLTHKANLNDKIVPICLPQDSRFCTSPEQCWSAELKSNQHCVTLGWGRIGGYSNVERLAELVSPLVSSKQCNSDDWYDGQVTSTMFCAGNKDAMPCGPDLGGPLLCAFNETWVVVGVGSWGEGCIRARKPAVYTKIEAYLDWIRATTALE